MTIADTNYLVRLFTHKPALQARQALHDLKNSIPESVYLRDYVVSELVYVLEFHTQLAYTRSQITKGTQLILSHPAWRCDRELHSEALGIFEGEKKLDYVDCLVAAEHNLGRADKTWTFDKELKKYLAR